MINKGQMKSTYNRNVCMKRLMNPDERKDKKIISEDVLYLPASRETREINSFFTQMAGFCKSLKDQKHIFFSCCH